MNDLSINLLENLVYTEDQQSSDVGHEAVEVSHPYMDSGVDLFEEVYFL